MAGRAIDVGYLMFGVRRGEAKAPCQTPASKVIPLAPDARRRLFFTLDRSISALAERGSKGCRKATWALDAKFATDEDSEPRAMLRARCALCPDKCKRPLV